MRRRIDGVAPPAELMSFPGWPTYTDAGLWERDFADWQDRRERWLAERGLTADQVPGFDDARIGDCPWDGERFLGIPDGYTLTDRKLVPRITGRTQG